MFSACINNIISWFKFLYRNGALMNYILLVRQHIMANLPIIILFLIKINESINQ